MADDNHLDIEIMERKIRFAKANLTDMMRENRRYNQNLHDEAKRYLDKATDFFNKAKME